MSIKIFEGFRFASNDFVAIHQHLMEWRTELRALHTARLAEVKALVAVSLLDGATVFPEEHARRFATPESRNGLSPYLHAEMTVLDWQDKVRRNEKRMPMVDFAFEIALLPFEGRVYGIVYTEQHPWRERWFEKPFVEEYGYWNNTDAPAQISPEDWAERKRVWTTILATDTLGTPAMLGFTATCTLDFAFTDISDVLAKAPPLDRRLSALAEHGILKARAAQEAAGMTDPPDAGTHDQAKRRARAWLRTDEGKAALQAEKERLRGVVKEPLTADDLMSDLVLPDPPAAAEEAEAADAADASNTPNA